MSESSAPKISTPPVAVSVEVASSTAVATNQVSTVRDCPRCCRADVELQPIPENIMSFLKSHAVAESLNASVCQHCLNDFREFVASPAVFLDNKREELAEKVRIWPMRMDNLKSGFRLFRQKKFDEAKENYDKYVETICRCFDNMSLGQISIEAFSKYARKEELNTFVLVLWDLVVIADMQGDPRLSQLATKFVELTKESNAKASLIIALRNYSGKAKNRKLFKQMLSDLGVESGCFIATYVFADAYSPELLALKQFRDHYLLRRAWGRTLVWLYYKASPILIRILPERWLRSYVMKRILRALSKIVLWK